MTERLSHYEQNTNHPNQELTSKPSALADYVGKIYDLYGQSKSMSGELQPDEPKYFLQRKFQGENDLLVILNTKRCAYQCQFCTLPSNSSREMIGSDQIIEQFRRVIDRHAYSLSTLDKITISNDGSVLDDKTLPPEALTEIVGAVGRMRRVRNIELETRLEYVRPERIQELKESAGRATIGILTGFETVNEGIRDNILGKREPLSTFQSGLDVLAATNTPLTAYILFKPDPRMTDEQAIVEAKASIQFLQEESSQRNLPLTVRLNPMYRARGSRWARQADATPDYLPPRLTDVMRVAQEAVQQRVPVYIGLSTENRAEETGTYRVREDFKPELIKQVLRFNNREISQFTFPETETIYMHNSI